MKLVLIRHGESEWNRLNLFTGWTDVELSLQGKQEAYEAGRLLKREGYDFDLCYTSYLKRAIDTLNIALTEMNREWLGIVKSWKLNERHYGDLQGLNKVETAEKYGEEQVKIWRRSYDVKPPILKAEDPRNPRGQEQYREVNKELLPFSESLKDTIDRVIPYFEQDIKQNMKLGKRVLIVAHGNSIRALIKYFEHLSNEAIIEVNVPTGVPLVYDFDENFCVIKKQFLGDREAILSKINQVANQGAGKN